jgi:phosphoribosylcarboxyaminoimidazole (NCAIR) mutase
MRSLSNEETMKELMDRIEKETVKYKKEIKTKHVSTKQMKSIRGK